MLQMMRRCASIFILFLSLNGFADTSSGILEIPETKTNDHYTSEIDIGLTQLKPTTQNGDTQNGVDSNSDAALPNPNQQKVEDARLRAKKILITALNRWKNKTFQKPYLPLSSARILFAPRGQDFAGCDEYILAFVQPNLSRKNIYICQYALEKALKTEDQEKFFAQLLIHEAAHLAGYIDECDASIVEMGSMTASKENLAFKNGYLKRCKLQ